MDEVKMQAIDPEELAKALWRADCRDEELCRAKDGRLLVEKWADPWEPRSYGMRLRDKYRRRADLVLEYLQPDEDAP